MLAFQPKSMKWIQKIERSYRPRNIFIDDSLIHYSFPRIVVEVFVDHYARKTNQEDIKEREEGDQTYNELKIGVM